MFQSAPRYELRGDCGPSKRLDRINLLTRFREPGEFFGLGFSVDVNEQRVTRSGWPGNGPRESLEGSPALGVRGSSVIESVVR